MSKTVGPTLLGRPLLSPLEDQVVEPTFFKSSYSLQHLRPTSFDPYSLWGRVQSLFFYVISYLFSSTPPPIPPLEELTLAHNQKNEMLSLFKECLTRDGVPTSPLHEYELLRTQMEKTRRILKEEKRDKETYKLRNNLQQAVQKLAVGKKMLLPVSLNNDVNLFYLLEKKASGYSLKVIGCDEWMEKLSDAPIKKMGGKEKILSQIAFKDIPQDYFTDKQIIALFWDPLFTRHLNVDAVKTELSKILTISSVDLTEKEELWVTKSASSRKALGLVMQELNPASHQEKTLRKRIEFKTKLMTLFTFFKNVRFSLEKDPSYNATLKYLVREMAKEASLLKAKNILVEGDLTEIQRELNFILKTVEESTRRIGVSSLKGAFKAAPPQLPLRVQQPLATAVSGQSFAERTPLTIIPPIPVTVTSFLTQQERGVLSGNDGKAIMELLQQKKLLAEQFEKEGQKDLARAVVMEVVLIGPWSYGVANNWTKNLLLPQILELQKILIDFTKLLVSNRESEIPLPNQVLVLSRLTKFSHFIYTFHINASYVYLSWGRRSECYFGGTDSFFWRILCLHYGDTKGYNMRPFYLLDEENIDLATHFFFDSRNHHPTPEGRLEVAAQGTAYLDQQVALFSQFFGASATLLEDFGHKWRELYRAAQPLQRVPWTKEIKNPLLFAALRRMVLRANLSHTSYDSNTNKHIEEDWRKMNFDRELSLQQPEPVSENPTRVIERQLEELLDKAQEEGETLQNFPQKNRGEYTKSELCGLLFLLREDYPQLEVFGFLKKHPHLLSLPDIRNYLEIVLFDIAGSSFPETLKRNERFAKELPSILEAEIEHYKTLAEKDPNYYNHLLFFDGVTRKCKNLYRVLKREEKFPTLPHLSEILANFSLQEFHFRAAFELLMDKIDQPTDLVEIIQLYHKQQVLPRENHDVDPNEMERLQRRYATLLQSIKEFSPKELSALLDSLCEEAGLPLNSSEWSGSFPLFSNGQYEIQLQKGQILDCKRGTSLAAPPTAIMQDPTYKAAFGDLDANTLRFQMTKGDGITVCLLSDKNGERGTIEMENGTFRFYKRILGTERSYQVTAATTPLYRSLAGDLLYFDPAKPDEALALDAKGTVLFVIQLHPFCVVDCRGKEPSALSDVATLQDIPSSGLKNLTRFESAQDILLFSRNGQLEKVEFVRYGLSFSHKNGKLYSDDPQNNDYYLDLEAAGDLPYSLTLRHSEPTKPTKIILPDPSTLVRETVNSNPSTLWNCWLLLKTWWTGALPDPKEFECRTTLEGPKREESRTWKPHTYLMRPYTKEIAPAEKEKKVTSAIALMEHALFNANPDMLLAGYKQLKLTPADLTRENLNRLLSFLRSGEKESGNGAAIKIQIALALKSLMGKKAQYVEVQSQLNTLFLDKVKTLLKTGRKVDQRLLLTESQFKWVAKIVQKNEKDFYEKHLRLLLLKEGESIPTFVDGNPNWYQYKEVPLTAIHTTPIEELEKIPPLKSENPLSLIKNGTDILFSAAVLQNHFSSTPQKDPIVDLPGVPAGAPSCEVRAAEKLTRDMKAYTIRPREKHSLIAGQEPVLKELIQSKREKTKSQAKELREKIDAQLLGNGDAAIELAIRGGVQKVSSFQEISIAFMQKDLSSVALPPNIDLDAFSQLLRDYFLAETNYLLLQNSEDALDKLTSHTLTEEEREMQTQILYTLLSTKRFYRPETNPELLVFECFSQQIFRDLSGTNQIELLAEMLKHHNKIFQAITGYGKSSVLSVLRALLQANGTNLVTFRLLPTLLKQSVALLQERLGNQLRKKITILLFDLKMSPIIREKGKKQETVESSLFKAMYIDLLLTTRQKGCVLTDYKSVPLLKEKWIKLHREFLARKREGLPIPPIEMEHWHYLRKILVLLDAREETMMDEFDLPNRSCNRLQIPLGKPVDLPPYLHQEALALFEELKKDPRLKLSADLQKELPGDLREEIIRDHATRAAKGDQNLLNYYLGKKELDPTGYSLGELDRIVFRKDQFVTFLPLTLRKGNGLGYKRSEDSKRTVPCPNGVSQENSKFGHPLEMLNYTILDYITAGVSLTELKRWIKTLRDEATKSAIPKEQFAEIFPNRAFPAKELTEKELQEMQKELNGNWPSVKNFLTQKLQEITASGEVISMTPHDIAAMPKAVSGLSATLGCPEELPSQFQLNAEEGNHIIGEMVYRLLQRTKNSATLEYDPENPTKIFEAGTFDALIDGAGAFRHLSPEEIAESFKGFYFTKARSRGADEPLGPHAHALLTVDGTKVLEDLAQNEGRMRLPGQTVQLARSKYNPELKTTEDILVKTARNGGSEDAEGLFRSKRQELFHLVHHQGYLALLNIEDFDASLEQFDQWQDLFIQKPTHDYNKEGSYFEANRWLTPVTHSPLEVLEKERVRCQELAKNLGIDVPKLDTIQWNEPLLQKMPPLVAATDNGKELEVEEEMEVEHEVEEEMEVEEEQEQEQLRESCGDIPWYPPWIQVAPQQYSAKQWFHPAFDERLVFTENFLPVERTDHLFKRTPFDAAMHEIGCCHVELKSESNRKSRKGEFSIKKIVIGDVLDDAEHRPYPSLLYDLRMKRVIAENLSTGDEVPRDLKDFHSLTAQVRFINGEYEGYSDEEWIVLCDWLRKQPNPLELRDFFENKILRTKPAKRAAFKLSALYKVFDDL